MLIKHNFLFTNSCWYLPVTFLSFIYFKMVSRIICSFTFPGTELSLASLCALQTFLLALHDDSWHFLSSLSKEPPLITTCFQKSLRVVLQWLWPPEKLSEVRDDLTCQTRSLMRRNWCCYLGSSVLEVWKAYVILDAAQKRGWYYHFGKPLRELWFSYQKRCLYLTPSQFLLEMA